MIGRARPCCVANYMPGKLPSLPERSPNKRTDYLLAIHKCRLALPTLDKSVKKVSPTSPVRCEMRRGSPGTSSHESQSLSHRLTYLTSTLRVHRPTHITCRQDPSWSDRCVESFFIFFSSPFCQTWDLDESWYNTPEQSSVACRQTRPEMRSPLR